MNINERSWTKIRNEYITTEIALRPLAKKHKVPYGTIIKRSTKEGWVAQKEKNKTVLEAELLRKTNESITNREADRIVRILDLTDRLAEKVEQAINELDQYILKDKERIREVEYGDSKAYAKPTKETINEKESIRIEKGNIDTQGLQQIANTLKSIKDINTTFDDKQRATTESILENMQTLTDVLSKSAPNRNIEDFE